MFYISITTNILMLESLIQACKHKRWNELFNSITVNVVWNSFTLGTCCHVVIQLLPQETISKSWGFGFLSILPVGCDSETSLVGAPEIHENIQSQGAGWLGEPTIISRENNHEGMWYI